jgi:divalent metal cation (Fe/Co/Zn/Cd) transporter
MKLRAQLTSQIKIIGYLLAVPALQSILFVLTGVVEFLTWIAELALGKTALNTIPAQILFSPIQHTLLGIFYFLGMVLLTIWISVVLFPKMRQLTQNITKTQKWDVRITSIAILSVLTIVSACIWCFLLLSDQNTALLLRFAMIYTFLYASYLSHKPFIQSLPKRLHAL